MARLRSIVVTYDDGTVIPTNMAAHLTDKEMLDYFAVGTVFNIGSIDDNVVAVASAVIVKTKYLEFYCRGELFIVNELGNIMSRDAFDAGQHFLGQWTLRGVTKRWNRNSLDVTFKEIWDDPRRMYNGYVYDNDHGTNRMWGGSYDGKIPRVQFARHVEV